MWNRTRARRGFLRDSLMAAVGLAAVPTVVAAEGTAAKVDESWLSGLTGKHRAFFDVAAIRHGILGRVDNFLNVYRDTYSLADDQVNVLFGAHGNGLGFTLNDAMWSKYQLGRLYSIADARTGAPALRNVFTAMEASYNWPADYSISVLQRRGVRFLACRGTMRNLARQLSADSPIGSADTIYSDLAANLVPGAIGVPGMIVAQNRAQEAGLKYVYVI